MITDMLKTDGGARELQERLMLLGQAADTVVHDVKNTLTVIRAAIELCEMKAPEIGSYAGMIVSKVDQTVELLQDLLAFSRGQNDGATARRTVDVPNFLHDLSAAHLPALMNAGIELVVDCDCEQAEFDPRQLQRVVDNLIANARDAMPQGGTLTLRATQEGPCLVLDVADTGGGMSPEVAARLFEPYFTSGKANGTGLGGAVVRSIVEAHDGHVSVHSELGEGTVVTLYLPQTTTLPVHTEAPRRGADPVACDRLTSPDPLARLEAIESLRRSGGRGAVAAIRGALDDRSADVRYAAVEALRDLRAHEELGRLRRALRDEAVFVRYAAAEALAELGDEAGRRALRTGAVWSPSPHDREPREAEQTRPRSPRRPVHLYAA